MAHFETFRIVSKNRAIPIIKNADVLQKWRKNQLRNEPQDYARNLKLFEAMYNEARALNILSPEDLLEGLESKIKLAKDLNVSNAT